MLRASVSRSGAIAAIAIVAVIMAFGGGYALGFVGRGSVVRDADRGLPNAFTPVANVTGIGDLEAQCSSTSNVRVRFRNSESGRRLRVHEMRDGFDVTFTHLVDAAAATNPYAINIEGETIRYHIFQPSGASRFQADFAVSVVGNNCDDVVVAVFGIGSEE